MAVFKDDERYVLLMEKYKAKWSDIRSVIGRIAIPNIKLDEVITRSNVLH